MDKQICLDLSIRRSGPAFASVGVGVRSPHLTAASEVSPIKAHGIGGEPESADEMAV